jgi:hypothetical protein
MKTITEYKEDLRTVKRLLKNSAARRNRAFDNVAEARRALVSKCSECGLTQGHYWQVTLPPKHPAVLKKDIEDTEHDRLWGIYFDLINWIRTLEEYNEGAPEYTL